MSENWNTAIGFYRNDRTAKNVLHKLKEKGFYKSLSIQHTADGHIYIHHFGIRETLFGLGLAVILSILSFALISSVLAPIFLSIALFTAWALYAFTVVKENNRLIKDYKNSVIRDETLIVAKVKKRDVRQALHILRSVDSNHPISFLLRIHDQKKSLKKGSFLYEPLTNEKLQNEAMELAYAQQNVSYEKYSGYPLIKRLKNTAATIAYISNRLDEAEHIEQSVTIAAEWLLDNSHVIQENISEVKHSLPKKYYNQLPKVTGEHNRDKEKLSRIYIIAGAIIDNTANRVNKQNILTFLQSYQSVTSLSIGELWALPLMLKLRLLERIESLAIDLDNRLKEGELASYWGNRLRNISRKEPERLDSFFLELQNQVPNPSPHFAEELVDHLYDEDVLLPIVTQWIEKKLQEDIQAVIQKEQLEETNDSIAFSSAIISLIGLSQLSWREIFEEVNTVEKILNSDPAEIYSHMGFQSKDSYRHAVETVAKRTKQNENYIAQVAVDMAEKGKDSASRHVGYYLIDAGRPSLEAVVQCCPSMQQRLRRTMNSYATSIYLFTIAFLTFLVMVLIYLFIIDLSSSLLQQILFLGLAFIPSSEIAIQLINLTLPHILPPHVLPKMYFETEIPEKYKTLVVVPCMLSDSTTIKEILHRLEVHHLANDDPALKFAAFFDFCDAQAETAKTDENLLHEALEGIKLLNNKYGPNKFYLFHRKREWNSKEQAWMGWERKRGKIEALNSFLTKKIPQQNILLHGDPKALENIVFVITLDADTLLPKDKAKQLIETLAHPLNAIQFSENGDIKRGYTIIQPRVSTDFSQEKQNLFSRIFSDAIGVDPYTQAISDVYQDLAREGSYHGKCIYDVQAFDRILSKQFPENHLLSHDLLEGAYVRVGYTSDICLFDSFPEDYLTWSKRQHRWMRGDWQIIDWLLPWVPSGSERKGNPLDFLNRWKIFDNLRRALLLPIILALLLCAWWISPQSGLWTLFATIVLFFPALSIFCNSIGQIRKFTLSWKQFMLSGVRAIINISLLPQQAKNSLDAGFRALFRKTISKKKLLEWSTGKQLFQPHEHRKFIFHLLAVTIFAVAVFIVTFISNPPALFFAFPFCILWALSPLIVSFLDNKSLFKSFSEKRLSEKEQQELRKIARKTWRFFDDFVNPRSNWLPPDNYQSALNVEIAERTSPTNIGLWLISAISAVDLKYITFDDAIDRIKATFETINKLELYEGHLLNWYDTKWLTSLQPRYVSTVDNGNFLASLWALREAIKEYLAKPVFSMNFTKGLCDTFDVFVDELKAPSLPEPLKNLKSTLQKKPTSTERTSDFINHCLELTRKAIEESNLTEDKLYWLHTLEKQLISWQQYFNRYFEWAIPLDLFKKKYPEDPEIEKAVTKAKKALLSLHNLASGENFQSLFKKIETLSKTQNLPKESYANAFQLKGALEKAKWLAGEKLSECNFLIKQIDEITNKTDMSFLYNKDRKLFSIGFHVNDCKLDNSFYDLLASEARIASLVSIAKGDIPLEHWWSLGRPYRDVNGMKVLVSWGGTMFEYLMPLLFTKHYTDSLLGYGCTSAVTCQILYGKKRGIPWGISESAYCEIDSRKIYQYRSFGVPQLGFKRGLENDLVVSPYSTALALAVDPVESLKNLNRLKQSYKVYDDYGFHEAIDFARQGDPQGERGIIVYAYMAHHQGMSLIAINNVLNKSITTVRFHNDPRIEGVDSLLYERIPLNPPITRAVRNEVPISRLAPLPITPIMGVVNTPHTNVPKVNLLANGAYSVMLTNTGAGYSKWRDYEITRWRSDTTCDSWGSFCFIKDTDTEKFWSSTYQPTYTKGQKFSAHFKSDKVQFKRKDQQIETTTEICVSPQDDAEIRLLTIANLSRAIRHIDLTSYSELSLAPHNADLMHPCFNKMFIETKALQEHQGLLAFRKKRSAKEAEIWAIHISASNQQPVKNVFAFETDREKFIGIGNSLSSPQAMKNPLKNSEGYVLDPIFSIRRTITLQPGERAQIAFITAIADSEEAAIELMKKYGDIEASHRALEMAWAHAQLELRHLRIHQEEAQLFQKLASHILYPHSQLRPFPERLKKNKLSQSSLWAYGISGDLPILAVTIADIHEMDLVKQVLTAHAFWRLRGLKVDLVILNEETTTYEHPLYHHLNRIIHSQPYGTEIGKAGGIFLLNCDQMPQEDVTLILAVARSNLVAARGFLRQHLVAPMDTTTDPKRLVITKKDVDAPSRPLPFKELPYFNGLGGFSADGKEYSIYLGPKTHTPAPWCNVIANPEFGCLVSESGLGSTWYGNSQTNRLTSWSNDPLLNPISDAIYIRDDERGVFWTPTPKPIRELDAYRINHGQGYTLFEHNSHGIEQQLLIFVPVDDEGGEPIRLQRLRLFNASSEKKILSIFCYTDLVLGKNKEDTQMHVVTDWDLESQALFAYNRYNDNYSCNVCFMSSSKVPSSYTGNRKEFIGRNHHLQNPAALKRKGLSSTVGAAFDPCGALHVEIVLNPGETQDVVFSLGLAKDSESASKMALKCRDLQWVENTFQKAVSWWGKLLGTIEVQTPELFVNFAMNRWLLYQDLSCRIWGRSGFYQSSGAYGFRDQLQDSMALLYAFPKIAREQILKAASQQFTEGDVLHWWLPPKNEGVRTKISDDLLWLPFVVAQYVRVTNDTSILNENVSFITGEALSDDQHEIFFAPEKSEESASILEHCRRAIYKGSTSGPNGLPLIGCGDWNDGMNMVGVEGKGESVWLGWFLIHVLKDFAFLLELSNQHKTSESYLAQAKRLEEIIENKAWDGNWYRRAYFDDGTPLGSKDNMEDKIDSLPQSWSIISRGEHEIKERSKMAMQSVDELLILKNPGLVLLLTPPFDQTPLDPGYIKGYPPGVRENGGQYTHGSLWVPLAFARMGHGDKACEILKMMHPVMHSQTQEDIERYRIEPYVLAGDVYALEGKIGRGGWSWYTGASAWMYRIWLEEILGFKLRGNTLTINPTLPTTWDRVELKFNYGSSSYIIEIQNPNHQSRGKITISCDGNILKDNKIPLIDDGKVHNAYVRLEKF